MKLFNLTKTQLNEAIESSSASTVSSEHLDVHPMNDAPVPEPINTDIYPEPYYISDLPRVQLMEGKGSVIIPKLGQATAEGNLAKLQELEKKIKKREYDRQVKNATKGKRNKTNYDTLKQMMVKYKTLALDNDKSEMSGSGPKSRANPPTEKQIKEAIETLELAKASQKGGLSPGLISGIADGLGKAAEGMHGTFQKGLDNISKQRQREFEKNQMTGWYDRKGARNDRRLGARNMKQIAKNMDYIRQEYIKERGMPLTDDQVFQMALEFSQGGGGIGNDKEHVVKVIQEWVDSFRVKIPKKDIEKFADKVCAAAALSRFYFNFFFYFHYLYNFSIMSRIKKAKQKKYKELYTKLRDFLDYHFDNFSQESSFKYTNRVIDHRKQSSKTYNMDNFRISCVIEEYEPSDED